VGVRRGISLAVSAALLLGLGAGVAAGVDGALGLRTEQVDIPVEQSRVAPVAAAVLPPAFTIEAPDDLRTKTAVGELLDAINDASANDGTTTLTVTAAGEGDSDSYTLGGTEQALTITAETTTGAVRGIYDLAAAVRDGRSVFEHLGTEVTSALPFRMVDLGAVGVSPDEEAYTTGTDYSHNSGAFADAILPDAPYVDAAALAAGRAEFEEYVRHTVAEGYNAIALPGFIEYLTFDELGIYAEGDSHVDRAEAMREQFGAMWQYASDLGMKVYLRTDMLALSTPLEQYFTDRFGGLDTANPEFWDVYRAGLDELYETMPFVDGVLIRIGEAGRVYDLDGWDYYSQLAVTDVASVRAMLTAFTAQAETAGKEVIFRSWSVGVGAVGDMHTNKDSYAAVLDGIDSPALIVSTKYTLGDFYSHLPFNDTLEIGDQRRIIEFQSRREFENFGSLPNDLGDLYSQAITRFIAANPKVEGIWTWTQDGGPWRAGPMTLELKTGFWQLYELNTELAVRLARDPSLAPEQITQDWIRHWFSTDPATVEAIAQAMALSREAITDGLYIGPYANQRVFALGLEPPPMMWIFEWDILTGDSAVLDIIYEVSKDDLDEAIAGGGRAVDDARSMQVLLGQTDPTTWHDGSLHERFLDTLDYEVHLLTTLQHYRAMVLRHAEWLDTGAASAYASWEDARDEFRIAAAVLESTYGGNLDYPAFNLTAANIGLDRAERDLPMAWAARVLLVLSVLLLLVGAFVKGARVARALWTAATRPWRATEAVEGLSRIEKALLVAIPAVALLLSRGIYTWFEAPAHVVVTSAAWVVLAAVLALVIRRRNPWPVIAAVGGAIMLRVILLSAVLAERGPGGYWFGFWTDPTERFAYISVAFALFLWVLVAAGWALAAQLGGRRAAAAMLASAGAVLVVVGTLIGAIGLETALTIWNDQMALLPWGLSRILGLTTYLEIPADTVWYAVGFGAVLLALAALVGLPRLRRAAAAVLVGVALSGCATTATEVFVDRGTLYSSIEQLREDSDEVVTATVTSQSEATVSGAPGTISELTIVDAGSSMAVAPDDTIAVSEYHAVLVAGETYLLFLSRDGNGNEFYLTGASAGSYLLVDGDYEWQGVDDDSLPARITGDELGALLG
jgi:hypothetical protein